VLQYDTPADIERAHNAGIEDPVSFNKWYIDSTDISTDRPNVNLADQFSLKYEFSQDRGAYVLTSRQWHSDVLPIDPHDNFFPINGLLWDTHPNGLGDQNGGGNNQLFTVEEHASFVFHHGQTFKATSDDDMWVFINGKRVVDLGGVHDDESTPRYSLDGLNSTFQLGLVDGSSYAFEVFYAERRSSQASFEIELDFPLFQEVRGGGGRRGLSRPSAGGDDNSGSDTWHAPATTSIASTGLLDDGRATNLDPLEILL
jgi:fibro-slime domain-containing protein